MSELFAWRTLVKGVMLLALLFAAYLLYAWAMVGGAWGGGNAKQSRRAVRAAHACLALAFVVALAACAQAPVIQPVRYQPVDVLIVKPCLAARKLPEPAQLLTEPACTKPAGECVRDAAADINELKREARESRNLLKECSR